LPHRQVMRARIITMAAQGVFSQQIARELGVSRPTVQLWRERFLALRLAGLQKDAPRPGRRPKLSEAQVRRVVEATLHTKPPNATHWSTRSMAEAQQLSQSAIQRIWARHNLKPHLTGTFKLSRDKQFVEKLYDIVGLYLNPPDKALVLCVDEKSQIQALDRTQPGLPLKPGRCGTLTHDYVRHGTTTLFAALSMLDGKVIGQCMKRHHHQQFIRFLKIIDAHPPGSGASPDHRQLQHAQASARPVVVGATSTCSSAFYPDIEFLAQSGGALVPRSHRQTHPSRQLLQCSPTDAGHHGLREQSQSKSSCFCLECPS